MNNEESPDDSNFHQDFFIGKNRNETQSSYFLYFDTYLHKTTTFVYLYITLSTKDQPYENSFNPP